MTDTELEKLHPQRERNSLVLTPMPRAIIHIKLYELFMVQNLVKSWFDMLRSWKGGSKGV